jgi:predicted lipoprotein with Yx(FWY)xxD motif
MRVAFFAALLLAQVNGVFAATEVPAGVTTRQTGVGVFLADAKGMTLYTYAQDNTPGKSACVDACAKVWPPLAAPEDAVPVGKWSLVVRDDDTKQWAFRGKPLYTYARDSTPAGAFGERVGNAWFAAYDPVALPPGMKIRALFAGRTLVERQGMTLYTRTDEKDGKSACEKTCLDLWSPLPAPLAANDMGDWTVLPRSDGTLQWAYQGKRLYQYAGDLKPGELKGDGKDKVWRAAILEPAAPLPSWITIQRSDMGEIFADAKGLTLYVFNGSLEKTMQITCNEACVKANWRTVPAGDDAKPSGDWTVIADGDGKRWAYRGNTLYTHLRDKTPGAIGGDKWAVGAGGGAAFNPIQLRRDYEE